MTEVARFQNDGTHAPQYGFSPGWKRTAYRHVGNNMRIYRLQKGFTIAQLADDAGIEDVMLSEYEAGTSWIDSDHIMRVAESLDVTICDLFS